MILLQTACFFMRIYLNKHRNALCKAPRPDGEKLGQALRTKFHAEKSCMPQPQVISNNSPLKGKYYVS